MSSDKARSAMRAEKVQLLSLAVLMHKIYEAEKEGNYTARNSLVFKSLIKAQEIGYQAGIRIDPSEPEWPVVFIELPTGQVSWHIPQHTQSWDGHNKEEKYERCNKFISLELDSLQAVPR